MGHEAAAEEPTCVLQVSSPCSDYKVRELPTGILLQSMASLRHLFFCHRTTCPVTQGWVSGLDLLLCFCASKLHLPRSLHFPLPFLLSFALCFSPCGSFPAMSWSLLPKTFEGRSVLRVSQGIFHLLVKKFPPLKV